MQGMDTIKQRIFMDIHLPYNSKSVMSTYNYMDHIGFPQHGYLLHTEFDNRVRLQICQIFIMRSYTVTFRTLHMNNFILYRLDSNLTPYN